MKLNTEARRHRVFVFYTLRGFELCISTLPALHALGNLFELWTRKRKLCVSVPLCLVSFNFAHLLIFHAIEVRPASPAEYLSLCNQRSDIAPAKTGNAASCRCGAI